MPTDAVLFYCGYFVVMFILGSTAYVAVVWCIGKLDHDRIMREIKRDPDDGEDQEKLL